MWLLLLSVLKLAVSTVVSLPYGYNNYATNAQIYHPMSFESRQILPYEPNGGKISHTLSTVNKAYGLMQHLTPPAISNAPIYYVYTTGQPPTTTSHQPRLQYYISPGVNRQINNFAPPVTPRINYHTPVATTTSSSTISELNTIAPTEELFVPTEKSQNDLEFQNTHNLENAYDDDDEDDGGYPQNHQKYYNAAEPGSHQKQQQNDPRDPKIEKPEPKLPERKDRIDFQVYGFDGPKSYKFGYDTGKGENRQFRYETRDRDGNVSGRYGYVDRSGKLNVVKYTSNADDGFRTETL